MTAPTSSTPCPDTARLRNHLAEPDTAMEHHLTGCPACARLTADLAARAGLIAAALDTLVMPAALTADLDPSAAAAAALDRTLADADRSDLGSPTRWNTRLPRLAVAAGVLALVVIVATPGGRSAVAQALDTFRSDRLAVVTIDGEEMARGGPSGAAFDRLADVDVAAQPEPRAFDDAEAAAAVAGIGLPDLTGTGLDPDRFVAIPAGEIRITLRDPGDGSIDAALVGSQVVVRTPPVVAASSGDVDLQGDAVGVARAGALEVATVGAPLDVVREYLLGRPELPPSLRQQLDGIAEWRTTLPIPVPDDVHIPWREGSVDGRQALLFGDESGLGAAVVVQEPDGGITAVAGTMSLSDALAIIETL